MKRRILIFITLFAGTVALAAEPNVTAVLSDSSVEVGQIVQMEIKVSGGSGIEAPNEIPIDGLEIHRTGTSRRIEMRNFTTSSSFVFSYSILPMRAGTFKIPAQSVRAGSTTLKTPELVLRVTGTGQAGSNASGGTNVNKTKIAWAEIIVPKKSAYVGEAIPAEIRVGIDGRARFDPGAVFHGPEIKSSGITVRKWDKPSEIEQTKDGRRERVFIYRTAISAAKTGHFDLKAELHVAMQWPDSSRRRISPRDIFGMDDVFENMMPNPFTRYTPAQEVNIVSEPVPLEVKPLPAGAPASFNGAVGNFSMSSEANPKRVAVGDPITVKTMISGRGSFDRMEAPVLSDDRGWHKYPATGNFKQDDDVGISGTKTFEMVVSPNEKKSALPPVVFSYFDPAKERYVTLQSEAAPLVVVGGSAAVPGAAASGPAVAPAPTTANGPPQILQQMKERGPIKGSFASLVERREFWLAQLLPLALFAGVAGMRFARARREQNAANRGARWQREADERLRKLRRSQLTPGDYFAEAARVAQLRTAAKINAEPAGVDAEAVTRAFALDENRQRQVQRMFAMSDELRYSGGAHNGAKTLSEEQRAETLSTIESLRA